MGKYCFYIHFSWKRTRTIKEKEKSVSASQYVDAAIPCDLHDYHMWTLFCSRPMQIDFCLTYLSFIWTRNQKKLAGNRGFEPFPLLHLFLGSWGFKLYTSYRLCPKELLMPHFANKLQFQILWNFFKCRCYHHLIHTASHQEQGAELDLNSWQLSSFPSLFPRFHQNLNFFGQEASPTGVCECWHIYRLPILWVQNSDVSV